LRASLWYRTMYGRTWVRVRSMYNEPLWLLVGIAFPLFTTFGLGFLYRSAGVGSIAGFAVIGGIAVSFWSNVVWSMATQFYWDKQEGIFELYLVSPAPISAILVGMSVGGFVGTAPSALLVGIIGWQVFGSSVTPIWWLIAESLNDSVQQTVSMFSGVYFPTLGLGSPFPASLQLLVSLIPLTIGMDLLRKAIFTPLASTFPTIDEDLAILVVLCVVFFVMAQRSIGYMRERGRKNGTLVVRLR
jgi:ABC-2 type transport system permease protein